MGDKAADVGKTADIGKRVRAVRKQHGKTMKWLGDQIGVSEQAISQYELGTRPIPVGTVQQIAKILSVNSNYLFGDPEEERFDRACDALETAGFRIDADESSAMARWRIRYDEYNIDTTEDEDRLMDIVDEVLRDAEARKDIYLKKRLIAEFDRGE